MNKKIDILQYDQILNNIPADIIVTDVNHIYRYLNKHAIKDDENTETKI